MRRETTEKEEMKEAKGEEVVQLEQVKGPVDKVEEKKHAGHKKHGPSFELLFVQEVAAPFHCLPCVLLHLHPRRHLLRPRQVNRRKINQMSSFSYVCLPIFLFVSVSLLFSHLFIVRGKERDEVCGGEGGGGDVIL